ncbi:MAG: DUF4968 domain-containing protein [Lachnospiraceae bacterium]|nr:DUF4968 domain-containing protein [Lachnospiraceae bacterium]
MLVANSEKSRKITEVKKSAEGFVMYSEIGIHRICPVNEYIVRITYTTKESFSENIKPGVINNSYYDGWSMSESENEICFSSSKTSLVVRKDLASYTFYDENRNILLKEREWESKSLEEFQAYMVDVNSPMSVEKINTPDGVKEVVRDAAKIPYKKLYHTRTYYEWQDDEAIYGLGQQEEGLLNLRNNVVYVHQANRKIAIPLLLSTKGYGLLTDTYSPLIFSDTVYGSYIYTEADEELDYYFIGGGNLNEVVKGYRLLTGKASMLPKWAFGYMQSQERYETAEEIISVAKEHRDRGIGLDCIVLDWCSWEDGMWGQKSFDKERFESPSDMIDRLHEMDVHFMISLWPVMNKCTENYKEMEKAGALLPGSEIYNALEKDARDLYWKQTNEGLFCHGVDAWWCDSSEPLTVEWMHKERMEPATMYAEYCRELQNILPTEMTNSYAYYHALTMYEGQRSTYSNINDDKNENNKADKKREKRVCNLTRSAYTGIQRLGTIFWSGDTDASWDTLRKQIACGLNFVATGIPYWTVDIGAFFVKNGNFWYWKGDYEDTLSNPGYVELYTRWYQWGAFLPIFRAHGTDCRREMWQFGDGNSPFYNAMLKMNRFRYKLMPYIYSQAGRVWLEDASMIKMLAFDYGYDSATYDIKDQYMFGESIMVCPVTEPMYYDENGKDISAETAKSRMVYLPKGRQWIDLWTNQKYEGGTWIETKADIDTIPAFVPAGSIIPMSDEAEHVNSNDDIKWIVYPGCDCEYTLYEDSGDGYEYEQGEYTCRKMFWNDSEQVLYEITDGNCVPVDDFCVICL